MTGPQRQRRRRALDDRQVRQIAERSLAGESPRAIAEDYGVSVTTVRKIADGRMYQHITGIKSALDKELDENNDGTA